MQSTKRRGLLHNAGDEDDSMSERQSKEKHSSDADSDSNAFSEGDASESSSLPTEDEIAEAQRPKKSKKTQKRKRRATSPSQFGSTLQNLLNTDTPSNIPLSLKPSVAKRRADEIIETKAKRLLEGEKKEKEERAHVADVIGGWGVENERSSRKVAQRGVVKLFNAIQQAQLAAQASQEEAKAMRGSGKPTLPAPVLDSKKHKKNVNSKQMEKSETMNQDVFLQMIKSGSVVSKS